MVVGGGEGGGGGKGCVVQCILCTARQSVISKLLALFAHFALQSLM